jgi:hypothetical protein
MAAALVSFAQPALAQSVWQRALELFGVGAPHSRYEYRNERYPFSRPAYGDDEGWQEDTRSYRSVCVRLCDGFYFPISNSVRRERLYYDSRQCMQRCDGEARLFYYPTDGGSVETMVDLAGRSYQSLPNAFGYRRALVAGCTCKPAPWSPEEAARHQQYAAEVAQTAADAEIDDAPGPTRTATGPSVEAPYYFEAPQAYERPEVSPPTPRPYVHWRRPAWVNPGYGWQD